MLVAKKMVKYCIFLASLFVCGIAFPTPQDDLPGFNDDVSIFFDDPATDPEGRIVGGTVAPAGAYPWMVALTTGVGSNFLCGGSIVTNRYVLTAAHCIHSVASGHVIGPSVRLRLGTDTWGSGGQLLTVTRTVVHDRYDPFNHKSDIGFFFTGTVINFNANARAVTLNYDNVGANVLCRLSGWGRTSTNGVVSPRLLELRTNTMDGNRCVSEMARRSTETNIRVPRVDPTIEICAFASANQGPCNGDSGSPLIRHSNNQQIGVTAWTIPCARGAPDVFVRISAFRTWIRRVIR